VRFVGDRVTRVDAEGDGVVVSDAFSSANFKDRIIRSRSSGVACLMAFSLSSSAFFSFWIF